MKIRTLVAGRRALLRSYGAALSGSAGRLVFALAYFVLLANTLPVAEFGIFATASAAGVVISRLLAFGFISPLYRISTVKPHLIGTYAAGFLFFAALSLPLLGVGTWLMHLVFFSGEAALGLFSLIILSEAIFWRGTEVIVIVNNGLGRFGRGAVLVIAGSLLRSAAAALFAALGFERLTDWAWFYLAANVMSLLLALLFFYPGHRLRLETRLYWRRLTDSFAVSGAEVMFYVQMELDKLLVLSLGGAALAGIYSIVMRLVDLTAIPVRAFSMMLVQATMRKPNLLDRLSARAGIEIGIFALSTSGFACIALILHFWPNLLGRQIGEVASLLSLALFIPALRNLVEYQSELLYARGRTVLRVFNLVLLAAVKALLLWLLLTAHDDAAEILYWLNGAFAVLYLLSLVLTYGGLRTSRRPV